MTHGDKAKAKKTASKASGSKKEVSKTGKIGKGKAVKAAKTGKEGGGKAVKAGPQAVKNGQKQQAPAAKASPAKVSAPKVTPAVAKAGAAGKGRVTSDPSGFSNPVIANAFKHAVKKFPNAFRKLTD